MRCQQPAVMAARREMVMKLMGLVYLDAQWPTTELRMMVRRIMQLHTGEDGEADAICIGYDWEDLPEDVNPCVAAFFGRPAQSGFFCPPRGDVGIPTPASRCASCYISHGSPFRLRFRPLPWAPAFLALPLGSACTHAAAATMC